MLPLIETRKRHDRKERQELAIPSETDSDPIAKYKTARVKLARPSNKPTGPRHDFRHKNQFQLSDTTIEYFDLCSNLDVGTEFDTSFRGEGSSRVVGQTKNYCFIVDLDSYQYDRITFNTFLGNLLQSSFYRFVVLVLVLLNAIMIGVNTYSVVDSNRTLIQIIDQIIFTFFFFEIIIKWIYGFVVFWMVWWNILDFLIFMLIFLSTMVPVIRRQRDIFAMVRVVRAFRILRSVNSLRSLNVVTNTMTKSLGDMLNILFVLIIFMFVMGIAGVALFDAPELETPYFQTVFDAWYVLFICVTQDGWVTILDEFRPDAQDPELVVKTQYFVVLSIFVIIGVTIGAFVFTNLIVAVVVANLELVVEQLRSENLKTDNPLDDRSHFSVQVLDVITVYKSFAKNNVSLLGQRPMRVPNLNRLSPRVIQTYLALNVALEQNMLEFVLIERDLRKVLSVLLAIGRQLQSEKDLATEKTALNVDKSLLNSMHFLLKLGVLKEKNPVELVKTKFPQLARLGLSDDERK